MGKRHCSGIRTLQVVHAMVRTPLPSLNTNDIHTTVLTETLIGEGVVRFALVITEHDVDSIWFLGQSENVASFVGGAAPYCGDDSRGVKTREQVSGERYCADRCGEGTGQGGCCNEELNIAGEDPPGHVDAIRIPAAITESVDT